MLATVLVCGVPSRMVTVIIEYQYFSLYAGVTFRLTREHVYRFYSGYYRRKL